ncbi:MAG: ATP-binding cassette domain-containing protein [Peptococcaceae bacterium]|nr:ATP-binding cassette domain-containing protein [Peptococcaceae bacterium]
MHDAGDSESKGGPPVDAITVQSLTFTYPGETEKALDDISLTIQSGAFAVLCGPSGCGKSTLLRQLKTVLTPHGRRSGAIFVDGQPLDSMDQRTQSQRIGFVLQSPDNQIVTDKVWHELAFGLESLGCDTPVIRRRVAEMASFFGIQTWFYKDVTALSGGQKQLLNLASVMVMQPDVLILDEPTSQLDPIAASEFLSVLGKINRELGTTIVLTEHRLEEAFALATDVIVIEHGRLLCSGTPQQVGEKLQTMGHRMFLAMPAAMRVWAAVADDASCPVTVRDGRQWLNQYAAQHAMQPLPEERVHEYPGDSVLSIQDVWFRYEQNLPDVVKGFSLTVQQGEFVALLGGNGTGKTTSLKLLAGLIHPQRGMVKAAGTIAMLPQNPQTLFFKKTVLEDLKELFADWKISDTRKEERLSRVIRLCHLEPFLHRHPYDLSGGQQQRCALAKLLLLRPQILLLDEPTKSLDAAFKQELAMILQRLLRDGVTIVMVSHDIEFCAEYAHRCALFFDGGIVAEAAPRAFFSGNSFYTAAANRIGRDVIPEAVTVGDIITACGGASAEKTVLPDDAMLEAEWPECSNETAQFIAERVETRPLPGRTLMAAVLILLLIPLTLYAGETYLAGRNYYVISLLILLECMLPFFLVFESRKPQARELVVVAVLCAIGVAGRAMFFMLPEFKPVTALTIIAGVAFGGETGFLVGAMTMLVSNMLFSQGPWTPWQMFAMGIIGFFAGILFHKRMPGRDKRMLAMFGAAAALFIYGGIMNPASALMWTHTVDLKLMLAYYISGFPMDCVHAAATAFFLWIAAEPMLEKLARVKTKYGLVEMQTQPQKEDEE